MKTKIRKIITWLLLTLLVTGAVTGCSAAPSTAPSVSEQAQERQEAEEQGNQKTEARERQEAEFQEEQVAKEQQVTEAQEWQKAEKQQEADVQEKKESEISQAVTEGEASGKADEEETFGQVETIDEDGSYTSKDEVALYLHIYGHLPDNYITKKEAQNMGWDNKKGNLDEVAPGKSIGGSYFGNYEGLLPEKSGRKYYECDLDYEGGYRGAKRLIYSDDGLIFYTEDHYKTFEQLY